MKTAVTSYGSVAAGGGRLAASVSVLLLAGLMWLSEIVDAFMGGFLDRFGIVPRTVDGLLGVPAAPLLHAGFGHLIANTGAFLILGILTAVITRKFWTVTIGLVVFGGLLTWLFGSNGVHIGASGLVYGYAACLVAYGIVSKRIVAILAAIFVGVVYGGIVWGVLPGRSGVSWESHLFGALVGAILGFQLARRRAG